MTFVLTWPILTEMFLIDSFITTVQGDGPFRIVDISDGDWGLDYIVRVDIDGNDASTSDGIEGVDWEYVYIPEKEANALLRI